MGLLDPVAAIVAAFCLLGVLLYKRVNLGITLTATAIVLGLLAVNWQDIPTIAYKTVDPSTKNGLLALSVILATFGIMWLSQLYEVTGQMVKLSESASRLVKNPKILLSVLPAILGLLPVAGGALMSAPIVDAEAEKLKLKPERKVYVNVWFRHVILPIYPLSPMLITVAGLTGTPIFSIVLLQLPIFVAMAAVGFLLGFWRTTTPKEDKADEAPVKKSSDLKDFAVAFSPMLTTVVVAVLISVSVHGFSELGLDVLIATFAGVVALALISRSSPRILIKPLRSLSIYGVTLAVYGAFLLRDIMEAAGLSRILQPLVLSGNLNATTLLIAIPMAFGFLTGSPSGAMAVGVSILAGVLTFTTKTSMLLYISAYLGYNIAPTHLCFTFTADYFKTHIGKVYKYMIPSALATFAVALMVYFLPFSI